MVGNKLITEEKKSESLLAMTRGEISFIMITA
jgi:hypothetical protein